MTIVLLNVQIKYLDYCDAFWSMKVAVNFYKRFQWGSGIWTSLDFEWSKRGWVRNDLDFKWDLKPKSPTI